MSDSVRPHRRQPTRLPRPWDSPGKNTGVGCHALLQGIVCKLLKKNSYSINFVGNAYLPHLFLNSLLITMYEKSESESHIQLFVTPWTAAY